jgi:hypothetical protein
MARKGEQETVSAREAAHRLGMTEQAIGQWTNQAPADTYELKANRRLLRWPQFPIWYRQHLQANREKPADFEAARTRKMAAEAEMAEYELEQMRGSLVPESTLDQVLGERLDTLRSKLQTFPGSVSARLVGLKSQIEVQSVLDDGVRDLMTNLSHGNGSS